MPEPNIDVTSAPASTTPKTGTSAPSAGSTPPSPEKTEPAWYDDIDEAEVPKESRTGLSKFKSKGALAKSYLELEKSRGNALTVPGENATEEERNAFFEKLGRPGKVEDYKLERPKLVGAEVYPEELEGSFLQEAHKAGLSRTQAQQLLNWWGNTEQAMLSKMAEQTKVDAGLLQKEWGNDFDKNLEAAKGAANLFVDGEHKDLVELLRSTGMNRHPAVVRFFYGLSKQLGEGQIMNAGKETENTTDIQAAKEELEKSRREWDMLTPAQQRGRGAEFSAKWEGLYKRIHGEAKN